MATADGWGSASIFANQGGGATQDAWGNYLASVRKYQPSQQVQPDALPSSTARVQTAGSATQTQAQPAAQNSFVQAVQSTAAQAAAQTASQMTPAMGRNAFVVMPQDKPDPPMNQPTVTDTGMTLAPGRTPFGAAAPTQVGITNQRTIPVGPVDGVKGQAQIGFNQQTHKWEIISIYGSTNWRNPAPDDVVGQQAHALLLKYMGNNDPDAWADAVGNHQDPTALETWQKQRADAEQAQATANSDALTAWQQVSAQKAAEDKQRIADEATKFSLAQGLQAPDTSAVDQAGQNALALLASQYGSSTMYGGADAAYLGQVGQRDAAQQASVNRVQHDTDYANKFTQNYDAFTTALQAQQQADANASANKLSLDIQGVSDALAILKQQSGNLSSAAQTRLNSSLLPLQQQILDYKKAVRDYGAKSSQAISLATGILSMGSSLAAAAL